MYKNVLDKGYILQGIPGASAGGWRKPDVYQHEGEEQGDIQP